MCPPDLAVLSQLGQLHKGGAELRQVLQHVQAVALLKLHFQRKFR